MDAPTPKISIITVVKNGASHLERCMQSVRVQKTGEVEYIVIDGESEDGTIDLIKTHSDWISHWISEPDQGIADAMNKGIAIAKGKVIGFIHADDELESGAIDQVLKQAKDWDILCGAIREVTVNSDAFIKSAYPDQLKVGMTVNHPSTFVKRSVYQQVGGFDPAYQVAMDYEFLLRSLVAGVRFKASDVVLATMHVGGKSQSHWKEGLLEVMKAKDHHLGRQWKHRLAYADQTFRTSASLALLNSPFKKLFGRWRGSRIDHSYQHEP